MVTHSSAHVRETPHETETTQTTISDALKRRAQSVINDTSIDQQWRNIVRYALEINDPLLPDLVRRADEGERIIDTTDSTHTPKIDEDHFIQEKLEALVDIICGTGGAKAAGALFVLMATIGNSTEPGALAYTAKHFAFTRCGELNLCGIVDAQIAVVERELLTKL
jgi:hypothetical protein